MHVVLQLFHRSIKSTDVTSFPHEDKKIINRVQYILEVFKCPLIHWNN